MASKLKILNAPKSKSVSKVGTHNGGHVYWVKPTTAVDYAKFYDEHFIKYENGNSSIYNTVAQARAAATANVGDVVYICEGYTETIIVATGLELSKAGVEFVGLGVGNTRPTITFSTAPGASLDITADNVSLTNVIGVAGIDGLTKPFLVSGDNCTLDVEWHDASASVEAETVVRLDTANNSVLKLKYNGFTDGNAAVRVVAVDDCDNVRIEIDGHGVVSTAWVNFVDAASTNVVVKGTLFTQGITSGARDIVDTIGSSTWFGAITDVSAGKAYSGGSGQAWASTDVTGLAAAIDAIDNFVDTEVASILTASGAVSDAVLADTIEGTAATTQSMMTDIKGVLQRIGADSNNNAAATTLVAANADGSLLERVEYIQNLHLSSPLCAEKSDGVVDSAPDSIFDITGGPIKVLEITGIVTTGIGAGTTNAKLQITTVTPASTVDMNAGAVDIDGDVAGTSYQTINTTGVLTPVTAGYVKEANAFATLPTTFLCPIGTIKFVSDAARSGNIKWYIRYVPLSPNSRVVASA